jgi:hypothetical protein
MAAMKPKIPALSRAMPRSASWLSSPKVAKKLLGRDVDGVGAEPQAAGDAGHAHHGIEQDGHQGGGQQPRQDQGGAAG